MAAVKIPKVKVGQVCWTTGGHVVDSLNGRLVKVTSVDRKGGVTAQQLSLEPVAIGFIPFLPPDNAGDERRIWILSCLPFVQLDNLEIT